MPIKFPCPACQKSLKVSERHAGEPHTCPACKSRVRVPARSVDSSGRDGGARADKPAAGDTSVSSWARERRRKQQALPIVVSVVAGVMLLLCGVPVIYLIFNPIGRPQSIDSDPSATEEPGPPAVKVITERWMGVAEGGETDTYRLALASQPKGNVDIDILTPDKQLTANPRRLIFTPTNWKDAQTVTVAGVDDQIAEDEHTGTVRHRASSKDSDYKGIRIDDVKVQIRDNDVAGITVKPTSGLATSEDGDTATFTVTLHSQPTAEVSMRVSSSNATEGTVAPQQLIFSPKNWNVAQKVTVTGQDDSIVDGDVAYSIVLACAQSSDRMYDEKDADDIALVNHDNEKPYSTPFREDFAKAKVGGLPKDWQRDNEVGVHSDETASWLQADAEGMYSVETPALEFPDDFELEVEIEVRHHFTGPGCVGITLLGAPTTPNITLITRWENTWDFELADSGMIELDERLLFGGSFSRRSTSTARWRPSDGWTSWDSLTKGVGRIRLVQEGTQFRVIFRDAILFQQPLPKCKFKRIKLYLGNQQESVVRIRSLSLVPHSKHRDRSPVTEFVEVFEGVRNGDLPNGWSRDNTSVAVLNGELQASAAGMNAVSTPLREFPDDFELEVLAHIAMSSGRRGACRLQIILEGRGNSPDLMMSFMPEGAPLLGIGGRFERSWRVWMTGVAMKTIKEKLINENELHKVPHREWQKLLREKQIDKIASVKLVREGVNCQLWLNGELVYAHQPRPDEFRRIVFRFPGPTPQPMSSFAGPSVPDVGTTISRVSLRPLDSSDGDHNQDVNADRRAAKVQSESSPQKKEPTLRTWTDRRGNRITATFVRVHDGYVILKHGKSMDRLAFSALSTEDQEYVRRQLEARGQGHLLPILR